MEVTRRDVCVNFHVQLQTRVFHFLSSDTCVPYIVERKMRNTKRRSNRYE